MPSDVPVPLCLCADVQHHWFGTTKMATRLKGGAVDNHGQVYGVTRLRVSPQIDLF